MKGFLVAMVIILLGTSMNAQQETKQDYLRKSKNQKTFAWILTGGGTALVIGGAVLMAADPDYVDSKTIGIALIGGGAAAITGGIILFSSARKNEQKGSAMAVQLHLKMEKAKTYRNTRLVNNSYPALAFSVTIK